MRQHLVKNGRDPPSSFRRENRRAVGVPSFRRGSAVSGYKGGFANLHAVAPKADPCLWGNERADARVRERGAWSSRPCRRKARLLTDKVTAQAPLFQGYDTCAPFFVATPTERNGTCRRMSLPGERTREGAPCYFFFASVSAASFASFMALSMAFLVGSTGMLSCPAASR